MISSSAGSSSATPIWRMKDIQKGSKLALGRDGLKRLAFSPGASEITAPLPSWTSLSAVLSVFSPTGGLPSAFSSSGVSIASVVMAPITAAVTSASE